MDLATVAIIATAVVLATLFTHVGIELLRDTRPRDPYTRTHLDP